MPTEYKKISELTLGSELTGTEQLEMVQAGNSRHLTSNMLPLRTYPYVTVGSVGLLSQSRVLTGGTGISLTDAGNTITVNATGVLVSTAQFVLLAADPDLPNERVLTGTANQVILTDNGAGSTIVLSTPQNIAPGSSPTFTGLTLTSLTGLLQGNGATALTAITDSSTVGQTLRVTGASTYAWGALDLADTDAVTGLLPVGNGGSGAGTLTGLLQGNGTSAFTVVTNSSTVGQVLRVTGAASYAWGAVDLADTDAVTGLLAIANGGTGAGTKAAAFDALSPMTALGDTIYGGASGTGTRLAGNITTTLMFLSQTGNGAVSAAPAWAALPGSFSGFANPTASVGLAAVNGVATTGMRSDAAPQLSQSITPTWTGTHIFNASNQQIVLQNTSAASNQKNILLRVNTTGDLALSTATDAAPTTAVTNLLAATHTGTAWTALSLGNATDNPTISFPGTGVVTSAGVIRAPDGLVGTPSFSFSGDPDTGIYHVATNQPGVAANGARAWSWTATQAFANDGTVGAPALAFDSDPDNGLYRLTTNDFAMAAGGAKASEWLLNGAVPQTLFADGLAATVGFGFYNDPNTGFYRVGNDDFAAVAGGQQIVRFLSTGGLFSAQDGSAGSPQFNFFNDADTGFYREGTNSIGVALGGGRAFAMNGASTTGASTPTLTANKPGANAGTIAWIPVLTAGATQGYIPIFGA